MGFLLIAGQIISHVKTLVLLRSTQYAQQCPFGSLACEGNGRARTKGRDGFHSIFNSVSFQQDLGKMRIYTEDAFFKKAIWQSKRLYSLLFLYIFVPFLYHFCIFNWKAIDISMGVLSNEFAQVKRRRRAMDGIAWALSCLAVSFGFFVAERCLRSDVQIDVCIIEIQTWRQLFKIFKTFMEKKSELFATQVRSEISWKAFAMSKGHPWSTVWVGLI